MPSKEERERRRAERLAAERAEAASQRRRLILGYIVAGVLTLAVVAGLIAVIASSGGEDGVDSSDFPEAAHVVVPDTGYVNDAEADGREGTPPPPIEQGDLAKAAEEAGCELQLDLPDEGSDHVPDDELPEWDTNPPTSGNHSAQQQADGAWIDVQPGNTLHSLEHGRIGIQYSPELSEKQQLELKGVFDEDPAGMLFFPNPEMPFEVAAAAWTHLIGCPEYEGRATLDAIRDFRDTYRGRGPEPFAINVG